MSQDKVLLRMEQKLDALLQESGLDPADFGEAGGKAPPRPTPTLTPAQQEAIDNAPKHIEARPIDPNAVPATPPAQPPIPPATPPPAPAVTATGAGKAEAKSKPATAKE